jgi:hypothetical protein
LHAFTVVNAIVKIDESGLLLAALLSRIRGENLRECWPAPSTVGAVVTRPKSAVGWRCCRARSAAPGSGVTGVRR